ncbi:unnamed protein product, partial [Ixodes persulcatus]
GGHGVGLTPGAFLREPVPALIGVPGCRSQLRRRFPAVQRRSVRRQFLWPCLLRGTAVTQDLALSRADWDVVGTSEKSSTSQCNELAFQRDVYVVRRRQEKQRERLKRMRESRKKPKSSSVAKPRRRGSILAPKLEKKKGKYSQLMTIGTPPAGLQGSVPRLKGVTMGVASASSPCSPVETEPEDDNSEHVSSSDKFIDNDTM